MTTPITPRTALRNEIASLDQLDESVSPYALLISKNASEAAKKVDMNDKWSVQDVVMKMQLAKQLIESGKALRMYAGSLIYRYVRLGGDIQLLAESRGRTKEEQAAFIETVNKLCQETNRLEEMKQ